MFNFGLFEEVVMAVEAERFGGFGEEFGVVGGVRSVTFGAAFRNGCVNDFKVGDRIIMALEAKSLTGFGQHFGQRTAVRFMTGGALAVIGGLVFDFGGGEKILVAGKADLLLRSLHVDRKL